MADRDDEEILRIIMEKGSDKAKKAAADALAQQPPTPADPPEIKPIKTRKRRKGLKNIAAKIGNSKYYYNPEGAIVDENGQPAPERIAKMLLQKNETADAIKSHLTKIKPNLAKTEQAITEKQQREVNTRIERLGKLTENTIATNNAMMNRVPVAFTEFQNVLDNFATQNSMILDSLVKQNDEFQEKIMEMLTGIKTPTKSSGEKKGPTLPKKSAGSKKGKVTRSAPITKRPAPAKKPRTSSRYQQRVAAMSDEQKAAQGQKVQERAERIGQIRTQRNIGMVAAGIGAGAVGGAAAAYGAYKLFAGDNKQNIPTPQTENLDDGTKRTTAPSTGPTGTAGGIQQQPSAPPPSTDGGVSPPAQQGAAPSGGTPSKIPGMTTLKTPGGREYTVAAPYAANFQGFVNELENSGYKIKSIGGYANRNIAGTGTKSYHSLGVAIDINPSTNPHLFDGRTVTDMPSNVGAMAAKYGLGWGGNWRSSKDTMHFSMAKGEGGSVAVDRSGVTPLPGAPGAPTEGFGAPGGIAAGAPQPAPSGGGFGAPGGIATGGGAPQAAAPAGTPQRTIEAPPPSSNPGQVRQMLVDAMNKHGVTDPKERAAMAAVVYGESGFKPQSETSYAGTSNERIRSIFGARVKHLSDAQLTQVKADPVQFFNTVYGGRFGNGPDEGYKYRGRGLIQLTFKGNYAKFAKITGFDLVGNPDLANDPATAAEIAVKYMKSVRAGGDTYTSIARGVGNPVASTEAKKVAAYNQFLQSGEFGADKGGAGAGTAVAGAPAPTTAVEAAAAANQAAAAGTPTKAEAPTAAGAAGAANQAATAQMTGEKPSNVTFESGKVDVSKVDPKLLQGLYAAAKEYGKPVRINSAYRGDEYQAQLWVRGRILKEPGIHIPAAPEKTTTITYKGQTYTVPGSGRGSSHGRGQAIDISPGVGSDFQRILAKYGITFPFGASDPPHIQLAGGSSFTPPAGGEPAPGTAVANAPAAPTAAAGAALANASAAEAIRQGTAPTGVQPVIVNNTRTINNTQVVRTGSSIPNNCDCRPGGFNPLAMAAGAALGKALRLF